MNRGRYVSCLSDSTVFSFTKGQVAQMVSQRRSTEEILDPFEAQLEMARSPGKIRDGGRCCRRHSFGGVGCGLGQPFL